MRAYLAAHPRSPAPRDARDPVARFRERALSLASTVDEAATPGDAPRASRATSASASCRCARCAGASSLGELDWAAAGIEVEARPARGDDHVGITGAFCAIAETGTLMMLSGRETPPTVSLLPETHIALVSSASVVRTMEDAWALLRGEQRGMPRAVNFISGPSRTADIEQTVTLGAHGPYRVHTRSVAVVCSATLIQGLWRAAVTFTNQLQCASRLLPRTARFVAAVPGAGAKVANTPRQTETLSCKF